MVGLRITPLTNDNKLDALNIVLRAKVGPKTRALRFFNQSLRRKRNNVFLAVHEGKAVGLIGWYKDDGTWAGRSLGLLFPHGKNVYWVSYFAIRAAYRNKGIGTQLMKYLQKVVHKLKARELWVYSRKAKEFYEKMGFQFIIKAKIEHRRHDFLKYIYD